MQRSAPYQRTIPFPAAFFAALGMSLPVCALLLGGCEENYPLEPTHCDRWCRLSEGCGYQYPVECTQACEETRVPDACASEEEALLSCYEHQDPSVFLCYLWSFRVQGHACEAERDAVLECESPGIGGCLEMCRSIQADYDAQRPIQALPVTLSGECAIFNTACEDLCFSVVTYSTLPGQSSELAGAAGDAGVPSALGAIDAGSIMWSSDAGPTVAEGAFVNYLLSACVHPDAEDMIAPQQPAE